MGGNYWRVDDAHDIRQVPMPMNGMLFFYSKSTDENTFTMIGEARDTVPVALAPPVVEERPTLNSTVGCGGDVLSDDFMENLDKIRTIREKGIVDTNLNRSTIGELTTQNPILQAGLNFEKLMKEKFTMSETCIVCHERDYGMHIMPKKKMCKTCNEESKRLGVRTEGSTHAMFGASNYMHPTPVPSVISDLTRLEVDCIRKICPQTKIYCRKGGKFLAHFFFFFLRSSCLISSQ